MSHRAIVVSLLGFALFALVSCDDDPTRPKVDPGWYSLGLENKQVTSLELDYPYLYACVLVDGLYRARITSTNPEWEHLGLGNADFSNVAAGALRGVLATSDGSLLAASTYKANNGTLYPGIHRSEDGGLSWAQADSGLRMDRYHACGATCLASCDHYTYAGSVECGIYRTEDDGQHWELAGGGAGVGAYSHAWIEPSPVDCTVIWHATYTGMGFYSLSVSQDHGVTWTHVHPSSAFLDRFVAALDPVDANTVYVGMRDSVLVTEDLGSTFEMILGLPDEAWSEALARGPSSVGLFVAAGLYEGDGVWEPFLYQVRDRGAKVDTLAMPETNRIRDLLLDSAHQTLYVATEGGVLKYVY